MQRIGKSHWTRTLSLFCVGLDFTLFGIFSFFSVYQIRDESIHTHTHSSNTHSGLPNSTYNVFVAARSEIEQESILFIKIERIPMNNCTLCVCSAGRSERR